MMGGGETTKQTKNAPWAAMEPYIGAGYKEAAKLYSQGPTEYTPWSQVANQNENQLAAMGGVSDYVNSPELQSKMAGAQNRISGLLDPNSNPYAGLTGEAQSVLAQNLQPQTMDASAGLNRLMYQGTNDPVLQQAMQKGVGSATDLSKLVRNPIASKIAGKSADAAKAGILSKTLANAYDMQNTMRMKAAESANTIQQNKSSLAGQMLGAANQYGTQATGLGLQYANPVLNAPTAMLGELSKVGAMRQQANQGQLTDATNRWNYQQNAPYDNLVKFRNLINPNSQWGVTNSTVTTPGSGQGIGQLAGTVLGATGGFFAGGPAGAAMGGQMGGALGGGIGSSFH